MEYLKLLILNLLVSINSLKLSKVNLLFENKNFYVSNNEEIIIHIKGSGTQDILGNHFEETNYNIYKGQILLSSNSKQINLGSDTEEISEIRLVFDRKLTSCSYLFENIRIITFVDLLSFDTSEITDMYYMFYGCHSITSINLGVFNTAKVKNFGSIFYECKSLKEIDISKFDTSSATNMASMFGDCILLTSLDLSHFVTKNVESMMSMFNGCTNLASLNLSSFVTSKVEYFNSMFAHCKSLKSLNLSNFITSKGYLMERMFYDCVNLEYINLDKATQSSSLDAWSDFDNIFFNVPKNLVICIHTFPKITSQLSDLTYYANDCTLKINAIKIVQILLMMIIMIKFVKKILINIFQQHIYFIMKKVQIK